MNKTQSTAEDFRYHYEQFMVACDSLEEVEFWDLEQYGDMDVYYENAILTIILRLVAADKKITQAEVDYINRCFGYDCSLDYVLGVYQNAPEIFDRDLTKTVKEDLKLIDSANAKLGKLYRKLILEICNTVAEGDGTAAEEEAILERLQNIIKG